MRYEVLLTRPALDDLTAIRDYVAEFDSQASAMRVLDVLLEVMDTLERFPERGSHPRELSGLGHHDFRQIVRKPWRVFYRVIDRRVYIALIADGRRDMRSLLARRLLNA